MPPPDHEALCPIKGRGFRGHEQRAVRENEMFDRFDRFREWIEDSLICFGLENIRGGER